MRSAPLLAAIFLCLIAHGASAHETRARCSFDLSVDEPVRCGRHHDGEEVRFAITTEGRKVVLLLTDRVVAMQLSDRLLRKIDRKLREAENEDEDGLGYVIKTAVLASVRSLMDHSVECDIRDIASADYRDGELILRARNGERIFANADVDDEDVMRAFSETDARAFVRELRRRMR